MDALFGWLGILLLLAGLLPIRVLPGFLRGRPRKERRAMWVSGLIIVLIAAAFTPSDDESQQEVASNESKAAAAADPVATTSPLPQPAADGTPETTSRPTASPAPTAPREPTTIVPPTSEPAATTTSTGEPLPPTTLVPVATEPPTTLVPVATEPPTDEDLIEAAVASALRQEVLVSVETAFLGEGGYGVTVVFEASDNFTMNLIAVGIELDMADVYFALFGGDLDVRLKWATVEALFPLTDQYGNSSLGTVAEALLDSEEAGKVNWEADRSYLSLTLLPGLYEWIFIHPALAEHLP